MTENENTIHRETNLSPQFLRKILFPYIDDPGNYDKEHCVQQVESVLRYENKPELNRIAALGVMGCDIKVQHILGTGRMMNCYVTKSDDRNLGSVEPFEYQYNPCTDSNQFDALAKELYETTSIAIAREPHPDGMCFHNSLKDWYEVSPDNSAGVALCIIAVIEWVFAKAESTKESE